MIVRHLVAINVDGQAADGCELERPISRTIFGVADASPSLQIQLMRESMALLEVRQLRRLRESEAQAEEARNAADKEAARVRRELGAVIELKNEEIDGYRREMDAIVLDMQDLYERQLGSEEMRRLRRERGERPTQRLLAL